MSASKLAPSASRNWLVFGGIAMLSIVSVGLMYRQFTGNTVREQRLDREKEKAAQSLAAKAPGNSESFSAKLLDQYQKGQRDNIDSEPTSTDSPKKEDPQTPKSSTQSSNPAPGNSLPSRSPASSSGSGSTGSTSGTESKDADAEYEERRARLQLDQSRRMGVWEAAAGNSTLISAAANSPIDALMAQAANAGAASRSEPATPAGSGSLAGADELLKRYMQQTGNNNASVRNKDEQFLSDAADRQKALHTAEPLRAQKGHGRYSLLQGSGVPVVMRSKVSSDIAGECRAQVYRPVYDSVTLQNLLIPAGSTLICVYSSETIPGQERLLLAFTRLIFPNGASVALGSMKAADVQGAVGVPAQVNSRFWKVFGSSFLIAAVAKVAENKNSSSNVTVNLPGAQASGVAATVLADVARKSLERNTNLRDELSLNPGDLLTLVLAQDMVLDPAITQSSH